LIRYLIVHIARDAIPLCLKRATVRRRDIFLAAPVVVENKRELVCRNVRRDDIDQIAPAAGLKKGDYQEVRMDVTNMVAAMAAKTVDAMVNVEPYNAIAEADGLASTVMDYWSVDKMPVFMAATPDFVQKNPDTVVAYLKAWQEVADDFKNNPGKVSDLIYSYFSSKGFTLSRETLAKALARVEVNPGFPAGLEPDLRRDAEVLLREKKIEAIPDWKKALRPDLWAKAAA